MIGLYKNIDLKLNATILSGSSRIERPIDCMPSVKAKLTGNKASHSLTGQNLSLLETVNTDRLVVL